MNFGQDITRKFTVVAANARASLECSTKLCECNLSTHPPSAARGWPTAGAAPCLSTRPLRPPPGEESSCRPRPLRPRLLRLRRRPRLLPYQELRVCVSSRFVNIQMSCVRCYDIILIDCDLA